MKLTDVEVILVHETDRAYKVRSREDRDAVWIPKAQCEAEKVEGQQWRGPLYILTLPTELAIEKGLV